MYLLDTNVLSGLRKGWRGHPGVRAWAASTVGERHCLSVLSLGEIRKGIEILRRKAPDQCAAFERWLARLESDYEHDIFPISPSVAERWGHLAAERSLSVIDGLLAATALEYRLKVMTRNTADFAGIGVEVVNPFG